MSSDEYDEPFFEEEGDNIELTPEELGKLEALAQTEEIAGPEEQLLPEEAILSPLELIPVAIANRQHLQITYTNRRQEVKQYVIEPHEIGGSGSHPSGYLWGWDINADQIKSFFLANLSDVQLLETTFIPRF